MFFRKSSHKARLTDLELIQKYKDTENNVHVGTLYERYSLQIYAICRKYMGDEEEARDTSMQVFEYLMKELLKYDIENFKGWLARAVKNFCLMKLRKLRRLERKEDEYQKTEKVLMETESFLHPNGEALEKEARDLALHDALRDLKDHQRICLELFYLKEKSYEEVAHETGFSLKEVKSYIQNGKRNLKIRLSQQNE